MLVRASAADQPITRSSADIFPSLQEAEMAAPKGNQFWRKRSSHGPKPKFEDPEVLWSACEEYFDWVARTPLKEDRLVRGPTGKVTHRKLERMRAMSLQALCIFLDLSHATWHRYRSRDGFGEIMNRAESVIRTQKFEGAAARLLAGNIIARDIRLGEREATDSDESKEAKDKANADEYHSKITRLAAGSGTQGGA
jgi:hypothetical protein